MALISDELSLWELAFRWEGRDPRWPWPWVPLQVSDHFRNVMAAILSGEVDCSTLLLEKFEFTADSIPEVHIRHHLPDVEACIAGKRFKRSLLQWALVEREDFRDWCLRRSIPLPPFWFPEGLTDFDHSARNAERERYATLQELHKEINQRERAGEDASDLRAEVDALPAAPIRSEDTAKVDSSLRQNQKAAIACQVIAGQIWKEHPNMTIADMVRREEIRTLGLGGHYEPETVRSWVREVAPSHVKNRRGRPKREHAT